jgi:DNA invertase Pin-like site-specific DNA recombinase
MSAPPLSIVPKPEPKPAVALFRVSDEKQKSLPTQREWAKRVSTQNNLTLVGEFEDDGISGASAIRPALDQMTAFVKERFFAREPVSYLLVLDMDRFSRRDSLSTGAWLDRLRKHGVRYIITSNQHFDLHSALDRTLIALGSDFTREPELKAKSNHTMNGMVDRARRGLWLGGKIPLGYRGEPARNEQPNKAGKYPTRLILGPEEELELVKWIFRTYASGRLTANGIARELNSRAVKPPRGEKWSRNTILKIIMSRVYLGCMVWGEQQAGTYHKLEAGMVKERNDKEDREQEQYRRDLRNLPVRLAGSEDCIIKTGAHPAIVDQEMFDACQRRREQNREDYSAPRCKAGLKGNVWPLAGQMKCGHCGKPVWTLPVSAKTGQGNIRHGSYVERARVACSQRRTEGAEACEHSGMAPYVDVLGRVIDLLKTKLGNPGAVAEMERELQRQLGEQEQAATVGRERLAKKARQLDEEIAKGTRALLQFPDDLKADGLEALRRIKAERDTVGQELRDLDAALQQEAPGIDLDQFQATLAEVQKLSAEWDSREEAELLRASLRDLVQEVRLYWRPRKRKEKLPRGQQATKRLLHRVEVDLTPSFADLLPTGSRSSKLPRTW